METMATFSIALRPPPHAIGRRLLHLIIREPHRAEGRTPQRLFNFAGQNSDEIGVTAVGGCKQQVRKPLPFLVALILLGQRKDHVASVG